jgi:hypothetical protein
MIWNRALKIRSGLTILVLILRKDRQQRTESYGRALGKTIRADRYIIAGSPVAYIENALLKKGIPRESVVGIENPQACQVAEALLKFAGSGPVVACAMGNIVGLGDAFTKAIENMSNRGSDRIRLDDGITEQYDLSYGGGVR